MNVCVAGWYFHKPFVEAMDALGPFVFWVCHKHPPMALENSTVIRNLGLEFGCYDWYLKNQWKGGRVLFTHDDNLITQEALNAIEGIQQDQVFLFSSEAEAEANGRAHGRAFVCSEKFLQRLKDDGGFWYNEAPETSLVIPATSATEPNYHNTGILTFLSYLKSLPAEFTVNQVAVVPGLKTGYRGRL